MEHLFSLFLNVSESTVHVYYFICPCTVCNSTIPLVKVNQPFIFTVEADLSNDNTHDLRTPQKHFSRSEISRLGRRARSILLFVSKSYPWFWTFDMSRLHGFFVLKKEEYFTLHFFVGSDLPFRLESGIAVPSPLSHPKRPPVPQGTLRGNHVLAYERW